MLKWLVLFGGALLIYRWVARVLGTMFRGNSQQTAKNPGDPAARDGDRKARSREDIVDVTYREVDREDTDGESR